MECLLRVTALGTEDITVSQADSVLILTELPASRERLANKKAISSPCQKT